jgi:large subunit ribosomal protein L9
MRTKEVEEPDFLSTEPERGRRYIYEESGYPRHVASQFVAAKQQEASDKLKDLRQKEPKFGDKSIGTNMAVYNQKHAEWEQQISAWQQAQGYWNDVKLLQDSIDEEERKRQNRERQAAYEADRLRREAEAAEERAKAFEGVALEIAAKVSATGQLYGSVNAATVAAELAKLGIEVDRKIITMRDAKQVGDYEATVHFHKEVEVKVPVKVVAENAPAPVQEVAEEAPVEEVVEEAPEFEEEEEAPAAE